LELIEGNEFKDRLNEANEEKERLQEALYVIEEEKFNLLSTINEKDILVEEIKQHKQHLHKEIFELK
jgi:hypothetical protein